MSKTYEKSNEALAILAQRGCEVVREKARDLLLRRNEGLIYDKALTYWNYMIGSDIDPYQKKPEPILLEKEHRREVFDSLDGCTPREKSYLTYRFGYPMDDERTKKETREHFGLSETRAEDLEQRACTHFKKNYIEIQRKTEETLKPEEPPYAPSCVAPRTDADRGMIIRWI